MLTRNLTTILAEAFERGSAHGAPDLSGQWAGESIPELLGDLIDEAEELDVLWLGDDDVSARICDEYEEGRESAAQG